MRNETSLITCLDNWQLDGHRNSTFFLWVSPKFAHIIIIIIIPLFPSQPGGINHKYKICTISIEKNAKMDTVQ